MQRICIYQNPDGSWIYQNLSKRKASAYSSLNSLVNSVFGKWLDFLNNRYGDDNYVAYKRSQLIGFIKNIIKA